MRKIRDMVLQNIWEEYGNTESPNGTGNLTNRANDSLPSTKPNPNPNISIAKINDLKEISYSSVGRGKRMGCLLQISTSGWKIPNQNGNPNHSSPGESGCTTYFKILRNQNSRADNSSHPKSLQIFLVYSNAVRRLTSIKIRIVERWMRSLLNIIACPGNSRITLVK